MEHIIIGSLFGTIIGYWLGQQNLIKMHRRLYNLNTNFNLLYAEYTEKDKIFDEIKKLENPKAEIKIYHMGQ